MGSLLNILSPLLPLLPSAPRTDENFPGGAANLIVPLNVRRKRTSPPDNTSFLSSFQQTEFWKARIQWGEQEGGGYLSMREREREEHTYMNKERNIRTHTLTQTNV